MNMIPGWQSDLLENGKGANYALYFSRMTSWRSSGGELKAEYLASVKQTRNGPRDEYAPDIERLGKRANNILQAASTVLQAIHTRQTAILKTAACRGAMFWEFRARLLSPFVSGLGSGHPTETGMILDRNSGLPYIPASAIKGVLRLACALNIAESEPEAVTPNRKDPNHLEVPDGHATLRRYLGDTDTGAAGSVRGQLVFLDAFPAETPTIRTDIMNPHFGKYYAGEQGPLETENPIPVKFLTVAPETEFVFRCFASPLPRKRQPTQNTEVFRPFDVTDEQTVSAMFTRAFDHLGFGAKTAVGYGRFKVHSDKVKEAAEEQPPETIKLESLEEISGKTFERFCQSLPDISGFPGKSSEIIRQIESVTDSDLRLMCTKAAFEIVRSSLKKALKAEKTWAKNFIELCKRVGINT